MTHRNLHYNAEDIALSQAPDGFEPIVSHSAYGLAAGPIFEKTDPATEAWARGFRVLDKHSNMGGNCHGGMLMTFADILLSRAVLEVAQAPFVTVRMVTDFVGPARVGDWVEGTATATGNDDGIVTLTGCVTANGKPVADLSSLFKAIRFR